VPGRIEDYALIGNTRTAALVSADGSIDWLCFPRFDRPACFAALLGDPSHGRWLIQPKGAIRAVRRRYRPKTLVLETDMETEDGVVRITDCMPLWKGRSDVMRVVHGISGRVPMRMELIVRFGYGFVIPWVRQLNGALRMTGGPDSLELRSAVPTHGEDFKTVAEFVVEPNDRLPFVLSHFPSHEERPIPIDACAAIDDTERRWRDWAEASTYRGRWQEAVTSSLITLKALTFAPTGGMIAAPTTSLPEAYGGVRNWDYRFCWTRDATFTLYAFILAGYRDEARKWRDWLLRAAAGRPEDLQTVYGPAGERQLVEIELDWLPGYQGARPVRIGNAAAAQLQLDVYGEVMDVLHLARTAELDHEFESWRFQVTLMRSLDELWQLPDNGIWEIRGPRQHFVHSKVMAWVAFDRAVKQAERFDLEGPIDHWRARRDEIHAEVCQKGFDPSLGSFVQHYGSRDVDANLLALPLVGFLPPNDPRIRGTVDAIMKRLMVDGFVARYPTQNGVDGLPPGEGAFLPCSFWLADTLALLGRQHEAEQLFERLVAIRNDVGLLSEEYDPRTRRMLGNFPQALSHVALVNSARNLSLPGGPSEHRSRSNHKPPPGSSRVAATRRTSVG
jgi:GH15 family glucan-1,4-alpha-glucosidase